MVIQQIETNVLTPLVMKHQVSLLPAITLLAQVAFSIFLGFMGLLLALPLLVLAQVCLKGVLVEDVMSQWESSEAVRRGQERLSGSRTLTSIRGVTLNPWLSRCDWMFWVN